MTHAPAGLAPWARYCIVSDLASRSSSSIKTGTKVVSFDQKNCHLLRQEVLEELRDD